jgi:hypothetical protein
MPFGKNVHKQISQNLGLKNTELAKTILDLYREAVIFPKHFQSFIVALKCGIFLLILSVKPTHMFAEA